jgi:glucitol operon activator protein
VSRFTLIVLALALGWILQLVLSGLQTKRFHQAVFRLKRPGCKTAVGLGGSNLKGKEYVVIVVNPDGEVVDAHRLRGMTVMASLRPAPEIIGLDLDEIEGERPSHIRAKTWDALQNAAGYIRRAMNQGDDQQENDGQQHNLEGDQDDRQDGAELEST